MQNTADSLALPPRRFERLLFATLLAERPLLIKLGALALVGALIGLGLPQISRMALDEALPTTAPRMLVVLSLCAVLVGAHQAWAGWIEDSTSTVLGAKVEHSSLDTLFSALLHSDYAVSRKRDAGWMSDTLSGASGVVHGYVAMFVSLVTQGFFALSYFGFMLTSSPLATLVVALVTLGIAALSWSFVRWEARLGKAALDAGSRQQELLHGLLGSLASLRGLFCTGRLGTEWRNALRASALAGAERARAATVRGLVLSGVNRALGVGVTLWAVYRCVGSQLGIGEMMLLTSMAAGLSGSLLALSGAWQEFHALEPQFERMNELLAAGQSARPPRAEARPVDDQIVLEDVWFRYAEESRWVVQEHSWNVARGSFVRLDAPSGSGKSTLLRILAGLLTPARGRARVFGIDARDARHLVLYIPQHCNLLEASIGENLRLLSGASDREIQRVAELTGLSEMLARLPMGVETPVAARGQNLSSGQRQLIVLTAAFASSRPVLLLDESTSQIDAGTRRRIQWDPLLEGRTVVAVEHASGT